MHHLQRVVTYAENSACEGDEAMAESVSDQHGVVVRVSHVEDTSWTLYETWEEIDERFKRLLVAHAVATLCVIDLATRSESSRIPRTRRISVRSAILS